MGDIIFRLFLHYSAFGQQMLNVFHLGSGTASLPSGVPSDAMLQSAATELANQFKTRCITTNSTSIREAVSNQTFFERVVVRAISTNPSEDAALAGVEGLASLGVYGAQDESGPLPPFFCVAIRFNRPSGYFRHGYKRFGLVTEDSVAGGQLGGLSLQRYKNFADGILQPFTLPASIFSPLTGVPLDWYYSAVRQSAVHQALPVRSYARFTSYSTPYLTTQNTRKR